jgi:arylsulfatase/arylsulfatase A
MTSAGSLQRRAAACAAAVLFGLAAPAPALDAQRPNVLVIMTDDQGYGDLGLHGNPVLRTPNLDRLAREGVRIEPFYVCPVCTPTRACLMTGRYNQRTRAVDTYRGRAMMDPDETTVAQVLREAGYRTGIFGKWHLGDNYPLRPFDRGFEESLVHRGGGLAQPAGPPGEGYFDPELIKNGEPTPTKGYCTDIFTDAAIDFLRSPDARPWFCYVAYNAPHTPLQLPPEDEAEYRTEDLSFERFPQTGYPLAGKPRPVDDAKLYGMVSRIDRGVGRILEKLESQGRRENTLVVFLTDNGPQWVRYNGGLRGTKGTVYEGGIRVPCFLRWPARLPAGVVRSGPAAHIDLFPTILAACGVPAPDGLRLDGVNLLPWLEGARPDPPERPLFFQWHRGDRPEAYRAFAVRQGRYKLVQPDGTQEGPFDADSAALELYDLERDPYEMHDLAQDQPDVVARLKTAYDRWFDDVCSTRGFDPPRIVLGTDFENPATLTRQDWRGDGWQPGALGRWFVRIGRDGRYSITARFPAKDVERSARVRLAGVERSAAVPAGADRVAFQDIPLREGDAAVEAWIEEGEDREGAHYLDVARR